MKKVLQHQSNIVNIKLQNKIKNYEMKKRVKNENFANTNPLLFHR